ncbi:hypothetical protein D3C87_1780600 [compost metagenome]
MIFITLAFHFWSPAGTGKPVTSGAHFRGSGNSAGNCLGHGNDAPIGPSQMGKISVKALGIFILKIGGNKCVSQRKVTVKLDIHPFSRRSGFGGY